MYRAEKTVQITEPGEAMSSLAFHEMTPSGKPLCGQMPRMWRGIQLVLTPQLAGYVDCSACAAKTQ
jgi:hypothetical protein